MSTLISLDILQDYIKIVVMAAPGHRNLIRAWVANPKGCSPTLVSTLMSMYTNMYFHMYTHTSTYIFINTHMHT